MNLDSINPKFSSTLRGIFAPPIPYEIRLTSGDWSPFFGQWEGQKHDDLDSNCCWAYSGNETLEDQLEFLWKKGMFSAEVMKWFQDNGYIDNDGDFYLSRRYIPILSGVQRNGNDQDEFWRITCLYGAIPNGMLPYTNNYEYFDLGRITEEMRKLGQEFLKRVKIQREEVGVRWLRKDIDLLKTHLFQSELQIGIPVPKDLNTYNLPKVKWDGGTRAQHSVALWKIDEQADYNYPYFIYDQYRPMLKQLSRDYFIPMITKAVVTPVAPAIINPVPQKSLGALIWTSIWEWFQRNPQWVHPQ